MEQALLVDDPGEPPLLLVGTVNNLLGPRPAVLALPLDSGRGQAPPYTAEARLPEIAVWYLPLPFGTRQAPTGFERIGDDVDVRWGPGQSIRIDPRLGVPTDDAARHGIPRAEWAARRDALMRSLRGASGRAEAGGHAKAAAELEAFASGLDGPPEVVSIAWYRAARLRLAAARVGGRRELELGLADVERALAAELDPPRYGLLHAELLVRLGRGPEALEALRGWWSRPAPDYYSFEWLILNWMAGHAPTTSAPERSVETRISGNWQLLARVAAAVRRGDLDGTLAILDAAEEPSSLWQQHRYWAARACLDGADPDPARALRELQAARLATRGMVPVPIALAETRARLIADPAAPVAAADGRAAVEAFRLAVEQAHEDPEMLFLLPWAMRDAEAVLAAAPELTALREQLRQARGLAPPARRTAGS
jgi:hypothetical protein